MTLPRHSRRSHQCPHETPPRPGRPAGFNLLTSDAGRSRDFYGQLFGWTSTEPQEQFGGYFNFSKDGVLVAGGMPRQAGVEAPETWSVYLATDDAQKTLEAATAHGGQILLPAMAVADLGTMGMVADAGGAAIGLWQPGLHKGFGVFGEAGTPAWFELFTRDYPASVAFYRDVFGWDTQTVGDTPEFRYTIMQHGADQLAGIMDASAFLPEGAPGPLVGLLRHRRRRRQPGRGHPPRRLGHQARRGHPLRPAGRGGRPDRRPLQARRAERGHAREELLSQRNSGHRPGR